MKVRTELTISAKMGKKIVAVAVLLVTLVNMVMTIHRTKTTAHVGMPARTIMEFPMIADKPDTYNRSNKHSTHYASEYFHINFKQSVFSFHEFNT